MPPIFRAGRSAFRRRSESNKPETAGMMRWLLTYADMITLILALFIILFALSTINRVKVKQFAKLVSAGFDNQFVTNAPPSGALSGAHPADASSSVPSIERELERYVARNGLQSRVQVRMDHRGLVISLLSDKSYYDSGSAELRPETKRILDEVASFLKKDTNLVRVEGNTDNVPISTPAYPTNWELSTARAVNVVRYLHETDDVAPTRLSAAGYGEFQPRQSNATAQGREANRRVDIVLLNANISQAEKGQ